MSSSFVAGGNIGIAVFVTLSATLDRTITQSASGDKPIGIAQTGTHLIPALGIDDGFSAIAGENVHVATKDDDEAFLQLGGTVASNDFLKPDGSGNGTGITATTGNFYGARALTAGTSGQLIKVQPAFGTL